MPRIVGEIVIERPPDVVFDFVADETNEPTYNPDLLQSEKITPGPVGKGTRFRAVHTSLRRPVEMLVEFTDYDRPRRLTSTTTMSRWVFHGDLTFESHALGTRMRWSWDARPKGLARVLTPVVARVGARQERAVWERLKGCLEAPPADTPVP